MNERKVMMFIAVSLDGFIARPDGDLGWLSIVEETDEDYGYNDFMKSIDTVIVGRRTYDKVLSLGVPFPYTDKECYIVTRAERPADGRLTFYTGDLRELVISLRSKEGGNIFVDGGAEIVNQLLDHSLFDQYIISIIPILLGNGIRLFKSSRPEELLMLESVRNFKSGLVQLRYVKKT